MALFGRNPNEAAYVGGKKHWTDVIKNSGPGELLIWRQPEEDFGEPRRQSVGGQHGALCQSLLSADGAEVFGTAVLFQETVILLMAR